MDRYLKPCLYGVLSYEYSLQCNLNHSILISYKKFMPKILTDYPKSAFLKLCFLGCPLEYLTHQLLLYSKIQCFYLTQPHPSAGCRSTRTFTIHGPKSRCSSNSHSGVLTPTVFSEISPFVSGDRTSRYRETHGTIPVKSNPENPMVNGQPRGIATRGAEPLPIKSPSTETAISPECATCTPLYKRGPTLLRHVGSSPFAGPRLQSSYCWKPRTPEPRC
jgi:hypothetical protein